MEGWIKLHRQLRDHWLWEEKRRFSKAEAWIDMLMEANHQGKKMMVDGQLVEIKRGQFVTSEVQLANRWGWDRKTVRHFFMMLQNDEMLLKNSTAKWTTVTLVNYEKMQGDSTAESTAEAHQNGQVTDSRTDTNKNVKNDKNEKKELPTAPAGQSSVTMTDVVTFWSRNIHPMLPAERESLELWMTETHIEPGVILEAAKVAVFSRKRRYDYIEGILRNWSAEGIKTLDDLNAHRREQNEEVRNRGDSTQDNIPVNSFIIRADDPSPGKARSNLSHLPLCSSSGFS